MQDRSTKQARVSPLTTHPRFLCITGLLLGAGGRCVTCSSAGGCWCTARQPLCRSPALRIRSTGSRRGAVLSLQPGGCTPGTLLHEEQSQPTAKLPVQVAGCFLSKAGEVKITHEALLSNEISSSLSPNATSATAVGLLKCLMFCSKPLTNKMLPYTTKLPKEIITLRLRHFIRIWEIQDHSFLCRWCPLDPTQSPEWGHIPTTRQQPDSQVPRPSHLAGGEDRHSAEGGVPIHKGFGDFNTHGFLAESKTPKYQNQLSNLKPDWLKHFITSKHHFSFKFLTVCVRSVLQKTQRFQKKSLKIYRDTR